MFLAVDLETIPATETVGLWKGDPDKDFPPIHAHAIVCLGWALVSEFPRTEISQVGCWSARNPGEERQILQSFGGLWDACKNHKLKCTLVTWNGRVFDVPVLQSRALKHRVPLPFTWEKDFRDRYSQTSHLDLKDFVSNYGAASGYHLDTVAKIVNLPGKMDVSGSDVKEMFWAGRLTEIADYCMCDVIQTSLVLMHIQYAKGLLSLPDPYLSIQNSLNATSTLPANFEQVQKLVTKVHTEELSVSIG